ncbi:hypothetical protein Deba_0302 [Desulfarculus baarsii DSM 2075]|uniref:Uncharacterized protein n=1 Tax=Desulfarculus baarsii (strain ATCC 33931 / DSM 2075 / LMG 7858 / VKM B-1802 / 2st14) TaxID=644282 RepID=E1QDP2_DESB2|nr:hypothetical protein [Desulfarculus baarsii]ADK83678.1 hypothetical protein Deba_0302 [Desulfarculus baarsii DSM 2075]
MAKPICKVDKRHGVPAVLGALVSLTGGNDVYYTATISDGKRTVRESAATAAQAEAKAWAAWKRG